MIHPFGGILPARVTPPSDEPASTPLHHGSGDALSRRTVLGLLGTAAVAPWLAANSLEAADNKAEKDEEKDKDKSHALYYVVPKTGKKISTATQKKLNLGPAAQGWPSRAQLANTAGFWAWVDGAGAEKIRGDENVETVEKFTPEDVQESGTQGDQGTQRMMVQLTPNGWGGKPKKGSFLSSMDLSRQWSKDMAQLKLMFRPVGLDKIMVLSAEPMQPFVLGRFKEHPQVFALQWGGGVAPTNAGREQGGGMTTRAVGEEGNNPTRAGQEQGGATTFAIGEEGAGQPRPPAGEVTTQALGEEGR
jgi:hypothetical protein